MAGTRRRSGRRKAKVALVCAGGGITGAVYEIGCLRALHELLGRSLLDLDLYVGISGGAFVSSLLAAGVSPCEMYDEATTRRTLLGVSGTPLFYRLGSAEFLRRTAKAPRVLADALVTSLTGEGRNLSDLAWALFELLPPGLMDDLRDTGVPPPGVPLAPARRHLRRPAPPPLRRGGRPGQRGDGGVRAGRLPGRAGLEGGAGVPGDARPLPPGAHRGPRLRGRGRQEDGPHQPRDPGRGRPRHLHQPDRPLPQRHVGRAPPGPPQQPRGDLGARPGHAHRAPRPHAVRPRALRAGAPGGGHPAHRAHPGRRADVRLQHHALQRSPGGGRARLPHGPPPLPATRRALPEALREARDGDGRSPADPGHPRPPPAPGPAWRGPSTPRSTGSSRASAPLRRPGTPTTRAPERAAGG